MFAYSYINLLVIGTSSIENPEINCKSLKNFNFEGFWGFGGYFGDTQSAAQYMKFMDGYDPDGKLDPNGEEAKELKVSSNKLKAVFDDREILNKDSLSRFHLDE